MTKRMLIDATHAEETRVVVLDDNKLEDFDVETSTKKQLKGNIYLAKIVRVEPSLQAAFVEYGGGRHGFLAFGEIHPDYYQIPVADRQRLLAMQAEEARAAEAEEDAAASSAAAPVEPARHVQSGEQPKAGEPDAPLSETVEQKWTQEAASEASSGETDFEPGLADPAAPEPDSAGLEPAIAEMRQSGDEPPRPPQPAVEPEPDAESAAAPDESESVSFDVPDASEGQSLTPDSLPAEPDNDQPDEPERPWTPAQPAMMARDERFGAVGTLPEEDSPGGEAEAEPVVASGEEPPDIAFEGAGAAEITPFDTPEQSEEPPPETIGGDDAAADGAEDARARRSSRLLRSYRIQEVIHRRQIVLVQVVKEERGTKGAALTTYISLAGRFSVLMPNSPRGGGISRKITSAADRKRLKEVTAELDLPQGMGLIVRTAGANRPKPEIKRDCEYLMRLWDDIREHTLRSIAPALIYEEASLIKRAIRDVYSRDIDEIIVDGMEGWRAAHEFMRMLMPSHAGKVRLWRGSDSQGGAQSGQPLFAKFQVEAQLDAMLSPTVQLKSGGYLVINQTEALVAIDVNSGRSTRERNIEETALRTNLEAADEAARQLRLRDLAGLIVIDFIDMESRRHVAMVEKRLKDALKIDRARIQVGHISHFGLLEMSRQRLRPSLAETSFDPCPHCGGTGHVRNIDSSAISVLRAIEDEGGKLRASVIMVHASGPVVMYLLNHKRDRVAEIELRFGLRVQFAMDDALTPGQVRIDRVRPLEAPPPRAAVLVPVIPAAPPAIAADDDESDLTEGEEGEEEEGEVQAASAASDAAEDGERPRRRRRRRRGGRKENGQAETGLGESEPGRVEAGDVPAATDTADGVVSAADDAEPDAIEDEAGAAEVSAPAGTGEQPSLDVADLDENGLPRLRRRGRRGGRRRRREGEEPGRDDVAPPGEAPEQYVAAPAYTGPTPANPFGSGAFDIFDMIDPAGESPDLRRPSEPAQVRAAAAEPQPAPVAVQVELPAENIAPEFSEPEPDAAPEAEPPAPEAEPPASEAEPYVSEAETSALEPAAAERAAYEPTTAEPAPHISAPAEPRAAQLTDPEPSAPPQPERVEPAVGPPIQPVIIGEGEPLAERRRGWWRR